MKKFFIIFLTFSVFEKIQCAISIRSDRGFLLFTCNATRPQPQLINLSLVAHEHDKAQIKRRSDTLNNWPWSTTTLKRYAQVAEDDLRAEMPIGPRIILNAITAEIKTKEDEKILRDLIDLWITYRVNFNDPISQIGEPPRQHWTPIVWAAYYQKFDVVQQFLTTKIPIDFQEANHANHHRNIEYLEMITDFSCYQKALELLLKNNVPIPEKFESQPLVKQARTNIANRRNPTYLAALLRKRNQDLVPDVQKIICAFLYVQPKTYSQTECKKIQEQESIKKARMYKEMKKLQQKEECTKKSGCCNIL